MTFEVLKDAVKGTAAAMRSKTILQPVGGQGDKVFPATFSQGTYAVEERRTDPGDPKSSPLQCVLLDSVASQANRAEEALLSALQREQLSLPLIEVDFSSINDGLASPLPPLTSLEVPHRLADAILRDCQLHDGTRFSKSSYAAAWGRATTWNATPVYQLCPTALLFGMWGSPEKPGGLGAKFERAFVSEIIGVDYLKANKREGIRQDPLGSSKNVRVSSNDDTGSYTVTTDTKSKGSKRPSEINHGNIVYESENSGVRFGYAEQTTVISFGALRKLRFPIDGKFDPAVDDAARTVLAALGLCAATLLSERNLSLRSRCHLWPTEERQWDLLERPGAPPTGQTITSERALSLFQEAVSDAESLGLIWEKEVIRLTPTPELADLVRKSQEARAKAAEGGDE